MYVSLGQVCIWIFHFSEIGTGFQNSYPDVYTSIHPLRASDGEAIFDDDDDDVLSTAHVDKPKKTESGWRFSSSASAPRRR